MANYYGLNLKEAAEKIASEFVLSYDSTRYSNGFTKQGIPKKSEYQIWMDQKRELFAQLSKLHEKLRQMKIKYTPKDRKDSTWSPLFALTEKEFNYVDYLYDYCMLEDADGKLKEKYEELRKELKRIEKRVYDTESGESGSDVGQVGERMAV